MRPPLFRTPTCAEQLSIARTAIESYLGGRDCPTSRDPVRAELATDKLAGLLGEGSDEVTHVRSVVDFFGQPG